MTGPVDWDEAVELGRPLLREKGISAEQGTLLNAAAVGLWQVIWRNGPIEGAHGGARGHRNGLTDGVMFARNTWICVQAVSALAEDKPLGLLELEAQILDRDLVWPGTSGTLAQFGRGSLGAIRKHVKGRVNWFAERQQRSSREDFLVLAALSSFMAHDVFGMPPWEAKVGTAMDRLRGHDDNFNEGLSRVGGWASFIGGAPPIVRNDLQSVERALLSAPYELGADALDWFASTWVIELAPGHGYPPRIA